ncbi:hypothetical protein, partial [Gemmiger sp.]|uniref:hypothetical protein n=1 Tax=Gemmiger sp. TaxID=2049027 RepID=UPI003AB155B7
WLLQVNGQPWCCGSNWSSFYALDIDNPEVLDYLQTVFDRVLNDWGFDLVKLDFYTVQRRLAAQANPAPRGCSGLWRCCAPGAATS